MRYRVDGQKMAVDPNNPDVVYVGTPQNGLFVTTNGGASWQSVSAVPVSGTAVTATIPVLPASYLIQLSALQEEKPIRSSLRAMAMASMKAPMLAPHGHQSEGRAMSNTLRFRAPASTMRSATTTIRSGAIRTAHGPNCFEDPGNGIQTVAVDPFNPDEIVIQNRAGSLMIIKRGGNMERLELVQFD